MTWLTGERTTRAMLVAVALGAVVMVTIGAGYRGSHALLEGAGAFVQKGHNVVHVNAESGQTDAEVAKSLATGRQRLEVVQVGPDSVWVVNNATGEVWRLPTSDMKPEKVAKVEPKAARLVSNGGRGYLIDAKRGTLTTLDSRTDQRVMVKLPAPATEVVVDSRGTAWAYSYASGELYEVTGGRVVSTIKAAEPTEAFVRLSLVGDRPVVYRATVGEVRTYGGKAKTEPVSLPKTSRPVEVVNQPVDAATLVWVVRGAGVLYAVDIDPPSDPRKRQLVGRERSVLGKPAVLSGRIYVPDQTLRQVVVLDLKSLEVLEEVDVPSGKEFFEVFVRDGRVWVNDPYAQTMLVFDRHGQHSVIDKGTGDGVDEENPRKRPKPTTKPTTQPTSRPVKPPITLPTERPIQRPTERPVLPKPIPTKGRPTRPPVTQKPPRMVAIPSFPRGTKYDAACSELRQRELVCNPVSAGDADGLGADEVIDTRPSAGTQIAVGKPVMVRYVGPEKVPHVISRPKDEACATIQAANLTCQENPEPDLARQASELLVVNRQDPGQGQDIDRGSTVSIYFRNQIRLPSFSGTQADACRQVRETYHMTCVPVTGDPKPGECTQPGNVYQQQPRVGATAQTGSRVTLTICPGRVPVDNYVGLAHNPNDGAQQTACARIGQQGFNCNPVKGQSPHGINGAQPYVVYAQDPAFNSKAPPGSTITVTYYSNDGHEVGNYDKANADAACAEIRNKGYQCQGQAVLHPDTGYVKSAVVGQDPAPGTHPLGTMFTLRYQDHQPVELWIYRHNTQPTYVLRAKDDVPGGYGGTQFNYRVGLGYPHGTPIADGSNINGFTCVNDRNPASCDGLSPNHFYSRLGSWQNYTVSGAATFMACDGAPGKRQIWRLWKDVNGHREYGLGDSTGGWEGNEPLGCVW